MVNIHQISIVFFNIKLTKVSLCVKFLEYDNKFRQMYINGRGCTVMTFTKARPVFQISHQSPLSSNNFDNRHKSS